LSYLILTAILQRGHLLAVPFRAATDLAELTAAERADLMDEIILGKQCSPPRSSPTFNVGFNLGAAPAGASAPPRPHCAALEWRHELHARHRPDPRAPQSLAAMYARLGK